MAATGDSDSGSDHCVRRLGLIPQRPRPAGRRVFKTLRGLTIGFVLFLDARIHRTTWVATKSVAQSESTRRLGRFPQSQPVTHPGVCLSTPDNWESFLVKETTRQTSRGLSVGNVYRWLESNPKTPQHPNGRSSNSVRGQP